MPAPLSVVYLHGFGSSPESQKAQMFRERLRPFGIPFVCPNLNGPDFFTVTVTRIIEQAAGHLADLGEGPVHLLGSSLGGFVALHLAEGLANRLGDRPRTTPRIERIVMLAPALDFGANVARRLGPEGLRRWRETNRLDVFHYGDRAVRPVSFALYEDTLRYDSYAVNRPDLPILIFHGRHDESVPPESSERFACSRPSVTLRLLDDDHQLIRHLDVIWRETAAFLGLPERPDDGVDAGSV